MKPKIIKYDFANFNGYKVAFLAIIKNGCVVDIACSNKCGQVVMYSEKDKTFKNEFKKKTIEVRARDLVLYTHWPVHTKEFWDLLNEP